MTNSQTSSSPTIRRFGKVLAIAIATIALAFWGLSRTAAVGIQPSGVLGLAALHQLAEHSIPYEVAIANGKPSLLEFYANWCSTCQAMAPTIEDLHREYGATVNFVAIDIDDPQWQPILQQYGVTGVPQISVLTADGEVVRTAVGKLPKPVLTELLEGFK